MGYVADTCSPGMVLPLFGEAEFDLPRIVIIVLYFLGLMWSFLGVGLVSDCFMMGIETITAQTKSVTGPDGSKFEVKIWNATVANLTLMALGSSAPEIMLSVIEILSTDYFAGELGPSCIVGSAAFNLLMITCFCVSAIPEANEDEGETGYRRIMDYSVFMITAFFSIFAYLWLLVILVFISPDSVEVWEGVVTFLLFPLLTVLAWAADRNFFRGDKVVAPESHIIAVGGHKMNGYEASQLIAQSGKGTANMDATETAAYLTRMALAQSQPSRAQQRINAMRAITGGKRILPKDLGHAAAYIHPMPTVKELEEKPEVNFASSEYSVLEGDGHITVTIVRLPPVGELTVHYLTEGITAEAGKDFDAISGDLTFADGEEEKTIEIKINDDDEVEDDETFKVVLSNPSRGVIGPFGESVITIIDDDEPGELCIKEKDQVLGVLEACGTCHFIVSRVNGSSGEISCSYETVDGDALMDVDYKPTKGKLVFKNGEVTKRVEIGIIDTKAYDKSAAFSVKLTDFVGPEKSRGFGSHGTKVSVNIVQDDAAKAMVDDVTKLMNENLEKYSMGNDSYLDQFKEAFDVGCEDGEEPTKMDYFMHYLTLPFKLFCAFVPPSYILNGKVCFVIALVEVGCVTILIGDLASIFGCALGIDPSTTAITFVALGTSLPDTFASMAAARGDETADNAIGNVTGSNAVNVFLGLGLPWMIAAFYWAGSLMEISQAQKDLWGSKYGWIKPDGTTEPGSDQYCPKCVESYPDYGFIVPAGALGKSVAIFCACAGSAFALLYYRRSNCQGEFGGPAGPAKIHSIMFAMLWFSYVGLSILVNYGVF